MERENTLKSPPPPPTKHALNKQTPFTYKVFHIGFQQNFYNISFLGVYLKYTVSKILKSMLLS